MTISNHSQHNKNPDYWDVLLKDIKKDSEAWLGKTALDFGCGCGRNVINLLRMAKWQRVDGIDISDNNVTYCKKHLEELGFDKNAFGFFVSNGVDLQPLSDNEYDFVMSTIVLQHICVYDIRLSILKDIFRVMKPKGVFSFQMTFGSYKGSPRPNYPVAYHDNFYDAPATNGAYDTQVDSFSQIYDDLDKIGFISHSHVLRPAFENGGYDYWIFVRTIKP